VEDLLGEGGAAELGSLIALGLVAELLHRVIAR